MISFSTATRIVLGSQETSNSIFSNDHRSSTKRMEDLDNSRAITAAVPKFSQAFILNTLVAVHSRHVQTYLEPIIIFFDTPPETL